jgi:hypothetical protein
VEDARQGSPPDKEATMNLKTVILAAELLACLAVVLAAAPLMMA